MKHLYKFLILLLVLGYSRGFASYPQKVLIEEMTSNNVSQAVSINPEFKTFIDANKAKIVPVTFHWNISCSNCPTGPEPFYLQNTEVGERQTRVYGTDLKGGKYSTDFPDFWVNGGDVRDLPKMPIVIDSFNNQSGKKTPVKLTVIRPYQTEGFIYVTVVVESDVKISNNPHLYTAIVEKNIAYSAINGEKEFNWTVREMKPAPEFGLSIATQAPGEKIGYTFFFPIQKYWKLDQMYFAAWVQDYTTHETFQAEEESDHSADPPMIRVENTSISFNDDNFNIAVPVNIKNVNYHNLLLSDILITGPDSSAFSITYDSTNSKFRIWPFDSMQTNLVFAPNKGIGTYSANIVIKSDASNKPNITIPINATVKKKLINPVIIVDTNDTNPFSNGLNFGVTTRGVTQSFIVHNYGVGALVVDSLTFDDSTGGVQNGPKTIFRYLYDSGKPFKLQPLESKRVYVRYNPNEKTQYITDAIIYSNDTQGNEEKHIGLSGDAGVIENPFSTLDFYPIVNNNKPILFDTTADSSFKEYDIYNLGTGDLTIKQQFSMIADSVGVFKSLIPAPTTIKPFEKSHVKFGFYPSSNNNFKATLFASTNAKVPDEGKLLQIPVKGTGKGVIAKTNGVSEDFQNLNHKFFIYPNPTSNSAVINYQIESQNEEKISIKLFNINGDFLSTILNTEHSFGDYSFDMELSKLISGKYIVRLEIGSKQINLPLIIQR